MNFNGKRKKKQIVKKQLILEFIIDSDEYSKLKKRSEKKNNFARSFR